MKFLCVVDEFTRECLALEVRRSFRAKDVIAVLAVLIAQRGVPAHLRSDNGPEFVALAVQAWLKVRAIGALYIAPGSPWENAYVESFNSRLRDEHLNPEEFASLLEAQVLAAGWRRDYNEARPQWKTYSSTSPEAEFKRVDRPVTVEIAPVKPSESIR